MRRWRVCHRGTLATGSEVRLCSEESHHLVRVVRSRPGDPVGVFDGEGREWSGEVRTCDPAGVTVLLGPELTVEVEPRLAVELVQAWCRPDRLEWILEKGTEVGIAVFRLVRTERSERPERPSRAERRGRIVMEACKQSGRRVVPRVEDSGELETLELGPAVGLLLDPTAPPGALHRALDRRPPERVAIAVGPEGGLSDDELERLTVRGWLRVGLGPRTLRVETAGVAAAAIVLHAWDRP